MLKNIILFITTVIFLVSAHIAQAQSEKSGIEVTPAIIHIDLAEDPPEYIIEYHNLTKSTVTLNIRPQDFSELEDGWKVNFLDEKSSQNYRYSLSSWIDFDKKTLTLAPGEKNSITVRIDESNLAPGGHYASILAEIMQGGKSDNVELKGVLSSLLFVRVKVGQEMEQAEVRNLRAMQDFWGFPYMIQLRFHNKGNVDLVPHGSIKIYNPFSELIVKDGFNTESLTTLPESIRRYDHALSFDSWSMPGFYRAEAEIKYGLSDKKTRAQEVFFSFGPPINIFAIGIALILVILLIINLRVKKLRVKRISFKNILSAFRKFLLKR